jgi:transposase-like protein
MRSTTRPVPAPGTSATAPDPKTVLTEASGHVESDVPRDRAGTFEPQIVKKQPRRLNGVDEVVLSAALEFWSVLAPE